MTSAVALEWVPINRYCEMTGETPDAVCRVAAEATGWPFPIVGITGGSLP